MKVSYTLALADYVSAIRLHRRLSFMRRLVFGLIYVGLPIMAMAGMISILFLKVIAKTELSSDVLFAEGILLFLSIALPLARIPDVRICFRRIFLNPKAIPTVTLEIDDDGIRSESPGVSEGKFFWNAIAGFAQNERITLLYVARKKFLFFPTNVLTPAQRAELDDLVARHVVRKQK
jgi:hypothetical protein